MSALTAFFVGSPTILAVLAGVIGALTWGFHQRLAGAKAEASRQAEADIKARDLADQVDNDIGTLPAAAARKELGRWSRS
jgi:hypothetical protein